MHFFTAGATNFCEQLHWCPTHKRCHFLLHISSNKQKTKQKYNVTGLLIWAAQFISSDQYLSTVQANWSELKEIKTILVITILK